MIYNDSEIIVTDVKKSDILKIAEIALESNLSYWSADDYYAEIDRSDSVLLVAREKDKEEITGFLAARLITLKDKFTVTKLNLSNFAEIYNIGVLKRKRNKKTGRRLILELLERCMKANVWEIWLEVRVSNTAAITFYKKMGFITIQKRRDFYVNPLEDAFVMKYEFPQEKWQTQLET